MVFECLVFSGERVIHPPVKKMVLPQRSDQLHREQDKRQTDAFPNRGRLDTASMCDIGSSCELGRGALLRADMALFYCLP
jgi:hypothetical protein